jgi:hypothetical protein
LDAFGLAILGFFLAALGAEAALASGCVAADWAATVAAPAIRPRRENIGRIVEAARITFNLMIACRPATRHWGMGSIHPANKAPA